jgi:hypothetical protein
MEPKAGMDAVRTGLQRKNALIVFVISLHYIFQCYKNLIIPKQSRAKERYLKNDTLKSYILYLHM